MSHSIPNLLSESTQGVQPSSSSYARHQVNTLQREGQQQLIQGEKHNRSGAQRRTDDL
jgi:hypothetical protein